MDIVIESGKTRIDKNSPVIFSEALRPLDIQSEATLLP
jgi:hypothetical protein